MSVPELDSITISGFKSIATTGKVELRRVNLLIGPNGSGKSNLLEAFSFMHAIREGRLALYVAKAGGAERLLHFGSKRTRHIHVDISLGAGVSYGIRLQPTDDDTLLVEGETTSAPLSLMPTQRPRGMLTQARGGREALISSTRKTGGDKARQLLRKSLETWRLYHVHDTSSTSLLRKTAQLHDNEFLRPDGSNLAAFLYLLEQKHESEYGLIRRTLQRIAPFFDDFRLRPDPLSPDNIRLEWRHKGSDQRFDAAALSDGTLRFITLATLLLQPRELRPSIILIDEPELGLHPAAITLIAALVKSVSTETQVLLSTQSPQLLDHFDPEDVLVASRVDGGTRLERLEAAPLKQWLEDYSLGQLWEKNEIGARPAGGAE